eukprot:TRINITY_DN2733_c0_g1_i1.p1 TRINITY_DN2733_c0_g1~~TRINITY_DN2733_c0_g1_i1.p1  ORF type:complete len:308 (+),score=67.47 TRINITY_DN2733_c0_g1_i1:40-924(+)
MMASILSQSTLTLRVAISVVGSLFLAFRSVKKKSLSSSGAIAAFGVGLLTCLAGYRFAIVLVTFFLTSSKLTKYKAERKKQLEDGYQEGGNRNAVQVFANGGWATLLCVWYLWSYGWDEYPLTPSIYSPFDSNFIILAFIGHYACCNGDTWASELGILNPTKPRLITAPWRSVPPGTNGGVSVVGTAAAVFGGAVIGLSYWVSECLFVASSQVGWKIVVLGALSGFAGAMIDSLLGATLQYSGWNEKKQKAVNEPGVGTKRICGYDLLTNDQVNLVSAILTSLFTAQVLAKLVL